MRAGIAPRAVSVWLQCMRVKVARTCEYDVLPVNGVGGVVEIENVVVMFCYVWL